MKAYLLWALIFVPYSSETGPSILSYHPTLIDCRAVKDGMTTELTSFKQRQYHCVQGTYMLPLNMVAVPAK